MKATVAKAELLAAEAEKLDSKLKKINREIQDLWDGMDYLSNPLKRGYYVKFKFISGTCYRIIRQIYRG